MAKFKLIFFFLFGFWQPAFCQLLPEMEWAGKDSVVTLYSQVDHQVKIKPNQADVAMMQLKAKSATVIKISDTLYQLRFQIPEEEVKIKLYYKHLPVDIITARVVNLEMPNIKFAGLKGNDISRADLNKVKKFELVFPAFGDLTAGLEFYTCKMSIIEPGKPNPFFINLRSPDLPAQLQGIIANLPINSWIVFEELKVKTRSNNIMNMDGNPVKFRVVE